MCYQKTAAWAAWQHDTFDLNGLNRRGARLWGLFAAEERAKGENEGDGENVGRSFQIGDRELVRPTANPRPAIGRDDASRNDAVHMRMMQQILATRVQDRQEADLRVQMPRIGGDFKQRSRRGSAVPAATARQAA